MISCELNNTINTRFMQRNKNVYVHLYLVYNFYWKDNSVIFNYVN